MAIELSDTGNFGIVVSGGPAPGINCVISSAVIKANNEGYRMFGFVDGFRGASTGNADSIRELRTDMVSSIYNTGGSILGTSRFNPFLDPETSARFISTLKERSIDKLIVIGGEGSAYLSYELGLRAPEIHIAHVPKTIDNDLVLPHNYPSFGFETARNAGTKILDILMVDAKTTKRWYLVTCMGRHTGFLALGLGLAAGATLTLVPEEYSQRNIDPATIAQTIFKSMHYRHHHGKDYGVALMAEGILDCLDPGRVPALAQCPRDEIGRLRYAEVELGDVLLPMIRNLCKDRNIPLSITTKNIGYELRCHDPSSFDIEYTKFLGLGAVKLLLEGKSNILVTRDNDRLGFEQLASFMGPDGKMKSRKIDLSSDLYHIARNFMIRPED
jgi:6-phosphofructokinase